MCRKRQIIGLGLTAFGLGLIFGQWFSSWLLCSLLGLILMAVGLCLIGRR